jgi:hypothetical protein
MVRMVWMVAQEGGFPAPWSSLLAAPLRVSNVRLRPQPPRMAPRVADGGEPFVEVPLAAASEDDALAWVMEGFEAGKYRKGQGRDSSPGAPQHRLVSVILVPRKDYDSRIEVR